MEISCILMILLVTMSTINGIGVVGRHDMPTTATELDASQDTSVDIDGPDQLGQRVHPHSPCFMNPYESTSSPSTKNINLVQSCFDVSYMGWNSTSINCGHQLVNATKLMVETSPLRATTPGSITSNKRTLIYRNSTIQQKGRKLKDVNLQKANSSFSGSILVDDHTSSSSWADLCKGYPVIGCRYFAKTLMDSSSQICSVRMIGMIQKPSTSPVTSWRQAASPSPSCSLPPWTSPHTCPIDEISPANGPIDRTSCMRGSGSELPSILKLSNMSPPSWQGPNLELSIMAHLHKSLCYWLTQGIPKDSLAVRSGLWMSSVTLWTLLCGLLLLSLSLTAVSSVIDKREVQQSCTSLIS